MRQLSPNREVAALRRGLRSGDLGNETMKLFTQVGSTGVQAMTYDFRTEEAT